MANINLMEEEEYPQNQHIKFDYPEQDENYKGHKLNQELRFGPLRQRQYKDKKCVVLFLIAWIYMIYIAVKSWDKGDFSKIYMPYDSYQHQCGKGSLLNYPYIYIIAEHQFYCVSRCPDKSDIGKELPCYHCSTQNVLYASELLISLCYPTQDSDQKYKQLTQGLETIGFYQQFYVDIEKVWPVIVGCIFISIILAILIIFLTRKAAGFIVWVMIVIYQLVLFFIGTVAYCQSIGYYQEYRILDDSKTLKTTAYMAWGYGITSFILIICLFKKIKQAIYILKVAADFLSQVWQAMFVPIYILILAIGFFVFWVIFSGLLYSTTDDVKSDNNFPYLVLQADEDTSGKLNIFFFIFFWSMHFLFALCQFVISSCCCTWYYSHQGYSQRHSILKSFHLGFTTSFGSLLCGAMVLPLIFVIKYALSAYHKLLKNSVKHPNSQFLGSSCIRCYIRCFEKQIRFLTKDAYIMMALTGQGFCSSAHNSFYVFLRNVKRIKITQGLGDIFLYIGVIFISAITTSICYLIITIPEYYKNGIINPLNPILVFLSVSLIIALMLLNLFGIGVDTILMCFVVDTEQNINEGGPKSLPNYLKTIIFQLL